MINIPLFTGVFGHSFRWFSRRISDPSTVHPGDTQMDVSENRGTPKSSILIGCSIIFTSHFGVPLFLETSTWFSQRPKSQPYFWRDLPPLQRWPMYESLSSRCGFDTKNGGVVGGIFFGCIFFLSWWFDVGFFFGCFVFFSILKGFWCFFDVLIFELMIWCWVSMCFFFEGFFLDDFWWFDVEFVMMISRDFGWFFELMIWRWILRMFLYDLFWLDDSMLDLFGDSFFRPFLRRRKNPQSIFLVEMKGIWGTTLWWPFARLIWFPWWVDFGVQNRFTLIHFDLILGYFPREKLPTANWVISRFPQGKKNVPLSPSLPFSQHHIKHLKKIGSAGCENCGPVQEMLQDFEITNNWDLGFYGYEGDVGARCLSFSQWISGEVWVGEFGLGNTCFFCGKNGRKTEPESIHVLLINVSSSDVQFHKNMLHICILFTYVHIKTTVTTSVSKYALCIWFSPSIPTKLTTHKKKITIVTEVTWMGGGLCTRTLETNNKETREKRRFGPKRKLHVVITNFQCFCCLVSWNIMTFGFLEWYSYCNKVGHWTLEFRFFF